MSVKFGTGGICAAMGPGPDQMNLGTVQEAALGVASYLKSRKEEPVVAIAYDSRKHSEEFAKEAARVLALKGCRVHLYPRLMPASALSFAVRYLKCDFGICVTAGHSPREYNGCRIYGADGCQVLGEAADAIQACMGQADRKEAADDLPLEYFLETGEIAYVDDKVIKAFLASVSKRRIGKKRTSDLKVVYTPLHGAGLSCVTSILKYIGIQDLRIVKEQARPNGDFPTCPHPNPEEPGTLEMGLKWCREADADLLIATDPDGGCVGVAAKRNGACEGLSGEQVGVLLLDYILKGRKAAGTLPDHPVVVKTIAATGMADRIAEHYGARVVQTLTGFPYIGEQAETEGFVFGFEEGCGYLIGDYARDRDAVGAAMLICEMADAYLEEGKTLWDVLEELYAAYGVYEASRRTYVFQGGDAAKRMSVIRKGLSEKPGMKMQGSRVIRYTDYLEEGSGLPKSDAIKLWTKDGAEIVILPSGTEPKIEVYTERRREAR